MSADWEQSEELIDVPLTLTPESCECRSIAKETQDTLKMESLKSTGSAHSRSYRSVCEKFPDSRNFFGPTHRSPGAGRFARQQGGHESSFCRSAGGKITATVLRTTPDVHLFRSLLSQR